MTWLLALNIIFCGFIDRMRGDPAHIVNRTFEKLLYGVAVGLLSVGTDSLPILASFAALFSLGSSAGWGEPLSSALYGKAIRLDHCEWWQVGPLRKNVTLALVARGLIWGAPCALLAFWDLRALEPLMMAVCFPLSVYIAKLIKADYINLWETNEVIRGLLIGGCCAAL